MLEELGKLWRIDKAEIVRASSVELRIFII